MLTKWLYLKSNFHFFPTPEGDILQDTSVTHSWLSASGQRVNQLILHKKEERKKERKREKVRLRGPHIIIQVHNF